MRIIGGNSKRRVEQRQEEAVARHELRWKRSPKQQLDRLDEMFGKDLGAVKERTRLLTLLLEKEQEILSVVDDQIMKATHELKSKSNEKTTKTRLSPKEIKKRRKKEKN